VGRGLSGPAGQWGYARLAHRAHCRWLTTARPTPAPFARPRPAPAGKRKGAKKARARAAPRDTAVPPAALQVRSSITTSAAKAPKRKQSLWHSPRAASALWYFKVTLGIVFFLVFCQAGITFYSGVARQTEQRRPPAKPAKPA
jgi:hypothetical protein